MRSEGYIASKQPKQRACGAKREAGHPYTGKIGATLRAYDKSLRMSMPVVRPPHRSKFRMAPLKGMPGGGGFVIAIKHEVRKIFGGTKTRFIVGYGTGMDA